MTTEDDKYNIIIALEAFKNCVDKDGTTIYTVKFITAYKEIIKFLDKLGKVFNFVKADLVDKFNNIEKCIQNDETGKNYLTVQSIIDYEKSTNIYMINQNGTLSILRLIRGLDFIRTMVENLYRNKDNNKKTPELACAAYNKVLAFRHNWAVRKIVKAGLYLLPYKADMIITLSQGIENPNDVNEIFRDFMNTIDSTYMIIYQLYKENDFLELVLA